MANNSTPNGATGGVSIISYLQKQRDGVVFQETFENVNFLAADGWTVLQGSPANTQAQAVAGISSWDNTAGNQSMPIAKKIITDTNVDNPNTDPNGTGFFLSGWFYDPLTTSGGLYTQSGAYPGPYLKLNMSNGKYFSIGVRNSISTSYYSYAPAGVSSDQPTSASTALRINGWHNFCFYQNGSNPGNLVGLIDGGHVVFLDTISTGIISEIHLCAGTSSDSGSSFGYFDQIGYYRNQYFGVKGTTSSVGLNDDFCFYNSSNNFISRGTTYPVFSGEFPGLNALFPSNVYAEYSSTYSVNKNLTFRTPLMTVNPGDTYSIQVINFGRKITTYDPFIKELQSVSQSTVGVRETNNYGLKGTVSFSINSLAGWSWKQANDNWFLNSVQGNPFSLMVDNVSDNAFGVISTSAFGGETNTVQIMPSVATGLSFPSTNQFTVGNYYYLRNNANTQKQMVQILSIGSSSISFDQNINFNVNPLDYVYSIQLYPFLEVSGDTQNGFKCDDPMIPRFKWSQNCAEYNNG
jgi:hypothetical protein